MRNLEEFLKELLMNCPDELLAMNIWPGWQLIDSPSTPRKPYPQPRVYGKSIAHNVTSHSFGVC